MPNYLKIPHQLRKERRWVVYITTQQTKKDGSVGMSKRPINANNIHYGASTTDPKTWTDIDTAVSRIGQMSRAFGELNQIAGIGFVLGDGWAGVDLDAGPGHSSQDFSKEMLEDIKKTLNTYTEKSMSGKGYHFIGKYTGEKLPRSRKGCIEIYSQSRFFVMTGDIVGQFNEPHDITEGLKILHDKYLVQEKKQKEKPQRKKKEKPIQLHKVIDQNFLEKAKKDNVFLNLWLGTDVDRFDSLSEADFALMMKLIEYIGRDETACCRAFETSPYVREQRQEKLANREDYIPRTFKNACEKLDQKSGGKAKKDYISIQKVREKITGMNMSVRLNLITGQYEVNGRTQNNRRVDFSDLVTKLQSQMMPLYAACSKDTIWGFLQYIAKENRYNPVLQLLKETVWDGKDRIGELEEIMHLSDNLSKTLVQKWLFQTVALQYNTEEDPFGAQGVLVLNGPQGVGKTTILGHLAVKPEWFGEGQVINEYDKDTTRRVVTKWITELGQVQRSLRNKHQFMRAFITSKMDEYRLPYGRSDIVMPRHTSIAATSNPDRYLSDPDGNRRWWTIQIKEKMKYQDIKNFDSKQLWAQIYSTLERYNRDQIKQSFRLDSDIFNELAARNKLHEDYLPGQEQIRDILTCIAQSQECTEYVELTSTQFKSRYECLNRYSSTQVGKVLTKLNIPKTSHRRYYLQMIY